MSTPTFNDFINAAGHPQPIRISTSVMRDFGFYWIRLKGQRWIVGEWVGDGFIVARAHHLVTDEEIAEVSDHRLSSPADMLIPSYMHGVPSRPNQRIEDALGRLQTALEGK